MGSHSEDPVPTPPTRRSLREAERRSSASSAPVSRAQPEVDSPAEHHVPSWAHHGPVAAAGQATEAIAMPVARPLNPPAAPPARPAWSTASPTRAAAPARPAATPTPPVTTSVARAARPAAEPRAAEPLAPVAAEPLALGVQDVPELAGVPHGTIRRTRRPTRTAARFGVLGVLAGITVVIPVTQGLVAGPVAFGSDALADSTLPTTVSALAGAPLSVLPPTSLASTDGALQVRGQAAASRTEERSALPGCDGSVRAAGQNGLLKTSDLCTMWDNHTQLRADAAVSLAELNQAFAARFGGDLCLSSGYRTLASQRAVKAQKGGLAAAPGKSNHGWGLAIDMCQDQTSGVKWRWINENAPTYGWENPAWAQPGGSGPFERWHWEYTKGVQADGEYYDS